MSRLSELLENPNDIEVVKGVQFSILSPNEIRRGSVCEVIFPETYEGNEPKVGGVFDPRMGVIEGTCATCENKSEICPGHFGHIELALPVFNIQYVDTIIKILRCVCFRCSNLLVNKSDPIVLEEVTKKSGKTRFPYIYNLATKIKKCQYNNECNVLQPTKYIKNRPDRLTNYEKNLIYQITAEFPSEAIKDPKITGDKQSNKQIITPQACYDILRKISAEDCEFLGFSNKYSRPEWMIWTVFPVAPPAMRPSVRQDNNQRSEDDLTYSLVNIVKNNKLLRQKIETNSPKNMIDSYHGLLQYYVATFVDNDIQGIPACAHRSGRCLKAITQRLKGKEGRVRGNIMGKRVDFSGRSVISVDPNISIDEYGVPPEIAMNLTYPETVTKYNMQDMYKLIRNGPNKYPGAKSIKKMKYDCNGNPSPCIITLKYVDVNNIILHEGDIVNRHLQDGDICLFNRQPSLHRMSMMAMKFKVLPGKTFKLNVFVTKPFNADFDGDEMNTHAPQSVEAANEIKELARVPTQIISPAKCKPLIVVLQDSLTAAYLLTQDDTVVIGEKLDNIMMNVGSYLGQEHEAKISGRETFSMILPPISLKSKNNSGELLVIENGKYLSGSLDDSSLGSKGLIQDILNMFGIRRCHEFLDDTQRLLTRWFATRGFSVGMGDAVPPGKDSQSKIDELTDEKLVEIEKRLEEAHQGMYETNLDNKLRKKSLELEILKLQSDADDAIVKYLRSILSKENRFNVMITAGTKGKFKENLKQIMGIVGQQTIWGSRIADGYSHRTLPHFHKYDFGPYAKGFVRSSFIKGLEPSEFFFHLMGGRTGLIDTAVKSITGDTPILITENGKARKVLIGDWIDNYMKNNFDGIENYGDNNLELLRTKNMNIYIPTSNNKGNVSWGQVTALTRHDPGKELYKIKTLGGREVIVPESKSLLIWNEKLQEFKEKLTPEIIVGDFVPVTQYLPKHRDINSYIDLTEYGIPEKLELNRENGVFIGLYLANGDLDYDNNFIKISNDNSEICEFVKKWFNKYSIDWNICSKSIYAYSGILVKLFGRLMGNKTVLNQAFLAPDDFVIGLLDGYFSGDGTVGSNCIESGSASKDLTEDIGTLCSRFGIFCEYFESQFMPYMKYRLSIRSQWAKKFAKIIQLTHIEKNRKLQNINCSNLHRNFPTKNDVVLDKIIDIKSVDVNLYPKLYDLTIPSTLNFAIANGLQCRDTSESGYISRRLMKALEDIKITYDGTVRNAANNIVQMLYGDDNYDPIKLEKVKVELIELSNLAMEKEFKYDFESEKDWINVITEGAMEELFAADKYQEKLEEEYQTLVELRDRMRNFWFKNLKVMDVITFMPFNLHRFIPAIKYKFNIGKYNVSDLSPIYIINKVNELCQNVTKYLAESDQEQLTKAIIRTHLASKRVIIEYKLNRIAFDFIINDIGTKLMGSFVQPGEMVGPIAAQSLGEVSTQLTLNSIEYNEKIIVKDNGITKVVKIGEFIDKIIKETEDRDLIENHPNDTILRWTKDTNDYEITSVDEDGNISWKKIEAVTRHPVINEDGSDTLIKVTTRNGRTVTATKAKSFLTRKNNKIVATNGSELKVGDRLPVMTKFPMEGIKPLKELSLEEYFPKTEYLWGSEMKKAMEYKKVERAWFKKGQYNIFTTPYGRGDVLYDATKDGRKRKIDENKIYMKQGNSNGITEKIKLDNCFGFFVGAYLAEGLATKTYIAIANNDKKYRQRIIDFCEQYQQKYHIQTQENKTQEGWTSIDIRIHSCLLAKLMKDLCNTGSEFKKVPDFAYIADDEFVRGLLDGYFSGDGYVHNKENIISCHSISEDLIDGIINLLCRFGILAKKVKPKKQEKNNRGSKNIKQHYKLYITNNNAIKFAENINLLIEKKQERLEKIKKYNPQRKNGKFDIIPGVDAGNIKGDIHRDDLEKMLKDIKDWEVDYKIIKNAIEMNLYFDEIVKIEETRSEKKYVYDLTVAETRNFTAFSCLKLSDTFHLSGTAAGSVVVTLGVPRMKEIINLSRNIKTPSMKIYLKPEFAFDRSKAEEIKNKVEYTKLKDIVLESNIIYEDPDNLTIDADESQNEDDEFIKVYNEFNNIVCVDSGAELSRWVLRLIFDREMMLAKGILMVDIQNAILQNSQTEDNIQCVISDDNSGDLVMRIKVRSDTEDEYFLSFFKDLEKHILDMTLRGIKNVTNANLKEDNIVIYHPDGSFENKKEWMIETDGTNLIDILSMDNIDITRTESNDIIETFEIFGIEAVRNKIIGELNNVFETSDVNQRHVAILADFMTYRGSITQIDRHGINRTPDSGVIAKATFEEVTDMCIKGSIFAELDKMTGVSANIMFGQVAPAGTNMFDILFDEDKMMNYGLEGEEQQIYEEEELDEAVVQEKIEDIYKDKEIDVTDEDFNFGYSLENVQEYNIGPFKDFAEAKKEGEKNVKIVETPAKTKKITIKKAPKKK